MNEPPRLNQEFWPPALEALLDEAADQFEAACQKAGSSGELPRVEDYVGDREAPERVALLQELIPLEVHYRRQRGETPEEKEYQQRFPELGGKAIIRAMATEESQRASSPVPPPWMSDPLPTGPPRPAPSEPSTSAPLPVAMPLQIGRYRLVKVLGEGGFGRVYLAHDEKLKRSVAIKVPHRQLVFQPQDAEAYWVEAQIVARLNHPHIVPVYDVGSTEDCPCFIVSQFIEGSTLAQTITEHRPSFRETAELVAIVAEALHHAHRQGLVHRDIKPSNLLIDASGKPHIADFGLALKEEDVGQGSRYAGTPAYMSPEQARGEGHRVDGRSDIFSLGVVFYELLTGRRPFKASSPAELREQITDFEPRPPRQYDDRIPKELERICHKAMAKRVVDRYSTAKDLAEDLWHFLAEPPPHPQSGAAGACGGSPSATPDAPTPLTSKASRTPVTPLTAAADSQPVKIVPKGLRSFDAHDADFFLELLPGPRDREGLPDSIRFWKSRIEETDPDRTFCVGLIYGPSGCGKSSLVKAGLLPRLSEDVIAVYIEATANETEPRLLRSLRKRCPAMADDLRLKETLAALRRGQGLPAGKKVLIVLDQFEQWLHTTREEQQPELVQALRQCDGGRVQCIVLVRDDFWMAATRFMRQLEIKLLEGDNSAAVDLFDLDHAKKVLAAFGRALGKLPEKASETRKEQDDFLNQALSGLAQERTIVCVRLALFAQMMKARPWTPASLNEVGGTEGIGVTFLEETFSAPTGPPEHRYHQQAARAVLKALLPESGSDIKGHMRSYDELLAASGYGSRAKDFDDLIRILDSELRLLTPTEPEGVAGGGWRVAGEEDMSAGENPGHSSSPATRHPPPATRYYQLTHDYLVPSLRSWLTRKQKETRRGRAELLLADRAAVWNARPENRQLPSLLQWLQIRGLVPKKDWTPPQQQMMRRATRYHALRGFVVALVLMLLSATGWMVRSQLVEQSNAQHAAGLVQRLVDAHIAQVPGIIAEMEDHRPWVDPRLREQHDKAAHDSPQKLRTSLALLPVDSDQVKYLYERLLNAEPTDLPVIREALVGHRDELIALLRNVLTNGQEAPDHRFRAACVLATYDPGSDAKDERWQNASQFVSDQLLVAVQNNPSHYAPLLEMFRPVRQRLLSSLAAAYRNRQRSESERAFATSILADYASDQPSMLADLLMDGDEKQFAVIYPKFKERGEQGLPVLTSEIDRTLPPDALDDAKEKSAKRQANAAVALLRMNRSEKVWPLLKHRPDPRVRSYLIHRLFPLGADARAIIQRLEEELDTTIRRALLLSLGEFDEQAFPAQARHVLLPKVQDLYRTDADPGLHAAAEWLLRQWHQHAWLKQVNDAWAMDKEQRVKREESIRQLLMKEKEKTEPQWYVNGQGQTMVVLPGPVEFLMGSPLLRHRIGRTFAIAAKPVTVEQFLRFRKGYEYFPQSAPTGDCPMHNTTWYLVAEYCNWLSEREGIPQDQWCFEPNPSRAAALLASTAGLMGSPSGQGSLLLVSSLTPDCTLSSEYVEGMKLKANYLQLTGYRLPTNAEWEYACRAGSMTSRYYGESEELLGKYAWYLNNSTTRSWPVGSLKPNDFGLFDMHGNVRTWCQERLIDYPLSRGEKAVEDNEDILRVNQKEGRLLRGGSFADLARSVRSAERLRVVPNYRNDLVGLRPVRTFR